MKHLGRQVAQMVHDALDAFARMDSQAALKTRAKTRWWTRSMSRFTVSASPS